MARRGLRVQPWAKRAGLAESTLRNFLHGDSSSMTQRSLEKLAAAEQVTVADMLAESAGSDEGGRLFDSALMYDVIASLERHLLKYGMELPPDRKAHAVLELYRTYLARRSQPVDLERHREDIRRLAAADSASG